MKLNQAIRVLMDSAQRDVRGSGLGFRSTDDAWRTTVTEAWTVAFKHIYKREPAPNEYFNAGMMPPR